MTVPERLARIETTLEASNAMIQANSQILSRLDQAIRGNGVIGIQTRLDRLEGGKGRATVWFDRLWKIAMSIAILWLTVTMAGCA